MPARVRLVALTAMAALGVLLSASCTGGEPAGTTSPTGGQATATTSSTPTATESPAPTATGSTTSPVRVSEPIVVAQDLDVPWGLAFLPDGSALVTLRDRGEVVRVNPGERPTLVGTVPGVEPGGEGGLMGIALSPDFASDATVFVYLTAADDNRILRMTFRDNALRPDKVILDGIPKAGNHDGGRIAFGPDGFLYVGTGDAGDRANSQQRDSLGGKILRVDRDGRPAAGNPLGTRVWTLGHRNPQGIAWDADGRMYASEFGQDTWDELNLIQRGRNYGWPEVEGQGGREGFTDPLVQWGTDEASPSGIAVGADGAVYMAALRGESLWRVPLRDGGPGDPQRLLEGAYGRLRTVGLDARNRLWILTSNTFRGNARDGDDKVVILPTDIR